MGKILQKQRPTLCASTKRFESLLFVHLGLAWLGYKYIHFKKIKREHNKTKNIKYELQQENESWIVSTMEKQ